MDLVDSCGSAAEEYVRRCRGCRVLVTAQHLGARFRARLCRAVRDAARTAAAVTADMFVLGHAAGLGKVLEGVWM